MQLTHLSDISLAIIALLWLSVATIQDIKKREVANWLSFSLLIFAVAIRAFASILSNNPYYFLSALIIVVVFFFLSNLLYFIRIFAGGDAKLLISLAVVFSTNPFFTPLIKTNLSTIFNFSSYFLVTFMINLMVVGSLYGLVYSITLAFRRKKPFLKEFRVLNRKFLAYKILAVILSLAVFSLAILVRQNMLLLFSIFLFIFPYLFIFVKAVENACMIKKCPPSKLAEGDWLFKEVKIGKIRIKPKWDGLTPKEISIIKKSQRSVLIKEGIPFIPVFLMALIVSFFANLVILLIQLFV